eukprot:8355260-Pyramimonas_sp.AAC.1
MVIAWHRQCRDWRLLWPRRRQSQMLPWPSQLVETGSQRRRRRGARLNQVAFLRGRVREEVGRSANGGVSPGARPRPRGGRRRAWRRCALQRGRT